MQRIVRVRVFVASAGRRWPCMTDRIRADESPSTNTIAYGKRPNQLPTHAELAR